MALNKVSDSLTAFDNLSSRQGGSFFLRDDKVYFMSNALSVLNNSSGQYYSSARSLRTNHGLLFKFSIYNYYTDTEEVELGLLINPQDIQMGLSFISSNSYTRQSWVSTLWGSQQQTIACSGVSAAFFIGTGVSHKGKIFNSGLTTKNRKETLGFINLLDLISMYRNNGNYFLNGSRNSSLYSSKSRVINVMDSILLSYDGSEYVGNFNSFTLSEDPSKPFNLSYNFEFVVSGMRGDAMEGHLRMEGNEVSNENEDIPFSVQGKNSFFAKTVLMSKEDLNDVFKIKDFFSENPKNPEFTFDFQDYKSQKPISGEVDSDSPVGTTYTRRFKDGREITYMKVTEGNTPILTLTDEQFEDNLVDAGGKAKDNSNIEETVNFFRSKAGSTHGDKTFGQVAAEAAEKLGYNLDPVLLATIINNESQGYWSSDGNSVTIKKAIVGDTDQKLPSLGVTQMSGATFKGLVEDPKFIPFMEGMGYKNKEGEINFENCDNDPSFGMISSIFLLNSNAKSLGIEGDTLKELGAYNSSPSNLKTNSIPADPTVGYILAGAENKKNGYLVNVLSTVVKK